MQTEPEGAPVGLRSRRLSPGRNPGGKAQAALFFNDCMSMTKR